MQYHTKKTEPYPLMWLSDRLSPFYEDIGVGVGCLKVRGNKTTSVPLCPGAVVLPPEQDPIRKQWIPHELSPVDPVFSPYSGLSLVERRWYSHMLESEYLLDGKRIVQRAVVFDYGIQIEMEPMDGIQSFVLKGTSHGACKLWYENDELHVIETSPELRPLAYVIRFNIPPDQLELDRECDPSRLKQCAVFETQCQWIFQWEQMKGPLMMEVLVSREGGTENVPDEPERFEQRLNTKQKQWYRFYAEHVPQLNTPDERINRLHDYLAYVYRSNEIHLGGLLPYPMSTNKENFCGFWMWNVCHHTIAGRWYGNRELVWGNLLNIENVQYPPGLKGAGTITNQAQPYGVDMFESDEAMATRRLVMPHMIPEEHGDGTHPPMFAQALEAAWTTDHNERYLRRLLPNALAYHDWFERRRRSERFPGLLLAQRWADSGMDNSKRWGHQGSGIYATQLEFGGWSMPMVTVDINVLSVLEKRSLANLLDVLGETERASRLREEADQRAARIKTMLWDPEQRFYCDREEAQGYFVPVLSPTGFYPMLLGDLDEACLDDLMETLFDPKRFWSAAPLPSLAMDDPDFNPDHSYWMGCTWISYNIMILRGLFRHRPDAGWKLLDRIIDMLLPEGIPNLFENYNPLTGQGYDTADFGWHGMLLDVIIQEMLGIKAGGLELEVGEIHCPEEWTEWHIHHLYYGGKYYDIHSRREGDRWISTVSLC